MTATPATEHPQAFTLVVDGALAPSKETAKACEKLAALFAVTPEAVFPITHGRQILRLPDLPRDVAAHTGRQLAATGFQPRLDSTATGNEALRCPDCKVRQSPAEQCALCDTTLPRRPVTPSNPDETDQLAVDDAAAQQAKRGLRWGVSLLGGALFLQQSVQYVSEHLRIWTGQDDALVVGAWIFLIPLLVLGYGIWHLSAARGMPPWTRAFAAAGPYGLATVLLWPQTGVKRKGRDVLLALGCVAVTTVWLVLTQQHQQELDHLYARVAAIQDGMRAPGLTAEELAQRESALWGLRDELVLQLREGGMNSAQMYAFSDAYLNAAAELAVARQRLLYRSALTAEGFVDDDDAKKLKAIGGDTWREAVEPFTALEDVGVSLVSAFQDWGIGYARVHNMTSGHGVFNNELNQYVLARMQSENWNLNAPVGPDGQRQVFPVQAREPKGTEIIEEGDTLRLRFTAAPEPYAGHDLVYAFVTVRGPSRGWPRTSEYRYWKIMLRVGGSLPDKYLFNDLKTLRQPVKF